MTYQPLKDRVAVVTGASRQGGIGRAIVKHLAALGAKVVVSDVGRPLTVDRDYPVASTEALQETVEELESLGHEALGVRCDITKPDELKALVDATVQKFGRLDIWVNNAGVAVSGIELVDVPEKDIDLTVGVNVKGTYLGVQAAARQFISQGDGGRIINVASQAGKVGFPLLSIYSASKFAVIGITQSAAAELGKHGINVNAVCPGTVDTELSSVAWAANAKQAGVDVDVLRAQTNATIPLGRFQTPSDVADLVGFLASDESGYITGESINTTGGQTMV